MRPHGKEPSTPGPGEHLSVSDLKQFANEKKQTLAKVDKSVKGAIDEPILPLVNMINACDRYYTTSSCSGRIIVTAAAASKTVLKKDTDWKFVSHEQITDVDRFISTVLNTDSCDTMILKFEPVIFHIRAINLQAANQLLTTALQSGFRNSGIVFGGGTSHRITVAFRHTASLEVPLVIEGEVVVGEDYLRKLVKVANEKMATNELAIKRLEAAVGQVLQC